MKIIKQYNKHKLRIKNQSGMSLIELMISMVVGLFMLAGLVTNFISNKNADVKRFAVSEMDANAAEAFRILRKSITHAGYRTIENTILDDDMAFHVENEDVSNVACRNGMQRDKWIIKKNKRTRDGSTKDFLTVISLADNPCVSGNADCPSGSGNGNTNSLVYTDCTGGGVERDPYSVACSTDPTMGMSNPMDAKIYNSFWLIRNNSSPENRTLYCGGNRSNAQPMVKDVESIQYLYGVRNDAGDITFRKANQVNNADQWPMVVSVQVGLLMRSSHQYVLDQASTKTRYNILNQNIEIANSDLQRLFRVYTTTINLENRNAGALL